MIIVFATTNPHKAQEMQQLLAPAGIVVRAASEFATTLPEPVEDAPTFEGNARIKAVAYAQAIGMPCLADDSGIEVTALNGAPGVHSARFAGRGTTRQERDQANRERLLAELAALGHGDRTARLVCTLCLADAQGQVLFVARGEVSATIAEQPRGQQGFGYDTLLLLPAFGKTLAELPAEQWNTMSHRSKAARALVDFLNTRSADAN